MKNKEIKIIMIYNSFKNLFTKKWPEYRQNHLLAYNQMFLRGSIYVPLYSSRAELKVALKYSIFPISPVRDNN